MLHEVAGMKVVSCRKGVAAIEFALVLPVLLVLVFGIIEFGLLMYNQQVITNASREGARAGIVQQQTRVTLAQIQSVVNTYCGTYLITFAAAKPSPTTALGTQGGGTICTGFGVNLDVVVTYPYTFLVLPSFLHGLARTKTLRAETVMRCE